MSSFPVKRRDRHTGVEYTTYEHVVDRGREGDRKVDRRVERLKQRQVDLDRRMKMVRDIEEAKQIQDDYALRKRNEDGRIQQLRISKRAEERAENEQDYINAMRRQERINKAVGVFSGVGNSAKRIRSNFKRLQNAYGRIKTDPFKNVNIMKNFNGGFGSSLDRSIHMPDIKIDGMYTTRNLENLYNDPFKRKRKRGKKKYKKFRKRY